MSLKTFFTKKKIIWTTVSVLVVFFIGYQIFKPKPNNNILIEAAKKQDLKQTVLATGQVVSGTDLSLGFRSSGIVVRVNVKEGDKVTAGQQLAILNQNNQLASLTSARGALAQAQANYNKVLAGASSQDIAVGQQAVNAAQVSLDNANASLISVTNQQNVLVSNAYAALLNSTPAAVPSAGNSGSATISVSGTYTGTGQGQYKISLYASGNGYRFQVIGLEDADGSVSAVPTPLGTKGLYIAFSGTPSSGDTWTVSLPNTLAANYITNYNSYQSALQNHDAALTSAKAAVSSAQVALQQAQAALDLKKAQARPADVEAAQAQILSAQGQVEAASAAFEDTILRAPASGTITSVGVKVGEQAVASKEVMVLQDVGNLHIEAQISEANVANLKPGQSVDTTFDALGPDRHFPASLQTINPASTVISGVVNYKVTASLEKIDEIKPGMTANMIILVAQKPGVVAVPDRAVISQDSKKYVRVVDDVNKKTYHQVEVQTGMEADGGLVEITSGLSDSQQVVTFIKQ
jgi:HlyD family secretion protein